MGYRYWLLSAIKYRLIGKSANSVIGASLIALVQASPDLVQASISY